MYICIGICKVPSLQLRNCSVLQVQMPTQLCASPKCQAPRAAYILRDFPGALVFFRGI